MLKNAYLLAKIGADTAENERHFAENLPKIGSSAASTQAPVVLVEAAFLHGAVAVAPVAPDVHLGSHFRFGAIPIPKV